MNITGSSKLLRNICEHLLTLGTYATLAEVLGWQKKKIHLCRGKCREAQKFML